MSKLFTRLGVPLLAVVALAGCGSSSSSSSSSSTTTSTSTTSTASSGEVASIAAQVPAAIKTKGTLTVATEAQYAPNEFVAPDGHTIIGMDPDLVTAIGEVMGLKVKYVNADFEAIIPGLAAGRYDLGASSFTDTKEREKTVDFVDYFEAGISFYAKAAGAPEINTIADICGKTVAVEKGTVEQEEAEKQSKKCSSPVKVLAFPGQNAVNLAVSSGRAELAMADSPVAEYQIKQSEGGFKEIGKAYEVAPYGLAIPKTSGMSKPILAALEELMKNGTYTKILEKWGIQSGAISAAKINGAIG
ncbi:MAG TPA: ABC transporter substrate-binding protein [Solirubrobacteraceae bacterium]|jgi:polar amino acid transport system substrate-binding protein|nr:ABC transporter substrate-binding protein [Solirubrobacteraceae bacterium]